MWIAVVMIGLALAMMVGPIMLMQPSKRQRRMAKLRAVAVERGLNVRMTRMPDGAVHAGETVPVYYRTWAGNRPLKETWLLARMPFTHGLHFLNEWDWDDERQAPSAWQSSLKNLLPQLPRSVLAVEAGSHTLGLYWLEHTGDKSPEQAVEELAQWIDQLLATVPLPQPRAD